MSFGPRLKTRVRLRPSWDEDECGCDPREPLWSQLLVAITPVVMTGALELYIDKKKRQAKAEREREKAINALLKREPTE